MTRGVTEYLEKGVLPVLCFTDSNDFFKITTFGQMCNSLIFTDELTRIIDNHPCCVAGDLFGRNVTGEGECFEEGTSVFNLTGSTGCSKVFYKCCKRYLPYGPQYSGCQFKIHKMSVKDFNRICQLKLLLSYFFI